MTDPVTCRTFRRILPIRTLEVSAVHDPDSTSDAAREHVVRVVLGMMATGTHDALGLVTEDIDVRSPLGDVEGREQLRSGLSDWRDGMFDAAAVIEQVAIS